MLKKLALGAVIVCALPFLNPSFRYGFKLGWNQQLDDPETQENLKQLPFNVRRFKNV